MSYILRCITCSCTLTMLNTTFFHRLFFWPFLTCTINCAQVLLQTICTCVLAKFSPGQHSISMHTCLTKHSSEEARIKSCSVSTHTNINYRRMHTASLLAVQITSRTVAMVVCTLMLVYAWCAANQTANPAVLPP